MSKKKSKNSNVSESNMAAGAAKKPSSSTTIMLSEDLDLLEWYNFYSKFFYILLLIPNGFPLLREMPMVFREYHDNLTVDVWPKSTSKKASRIEKFTIISKPVVGYLHFDEASAGQEG